MDREAAGDARPEWLLMYRKGMTRKKIAKLTRTDVSIVASHIARAMEADPGLHAEHAAAVKGSAKGAVPGLQRMRQVLATVEATGRYPSSNADDRTERELAQWLRRRRRDAEAGVLNPVISQGLAALPDWQRKPGEISKEQKWHDRLQELTEYRAAGNPWPRSSTTATGHEHELGVWLRTQRFKHRRGQLATARVQALDTSLPGWTDGRSSVTGPT